MKIHKEGFKIIAVTMAVLLILLTFILLFVKILWLSVLLIILLALEFTWTVFFFRVPIRVINSGNQILATADGEVVAIEEVVEKEYFNEKRLMVSVFMSPFNVHVNWYPFSGKVVHVEYHPGKFLIAHHPKSSELNERNSVVLEKEPGQDVLIRQVAGIMARRIICYSKEGDQVKQGDEFGIIRFGSRVDFFLPVGSVIKVKLGDKVRARQTVIGYFSN